MRFSVHLVILLLLCACGDDGFRKVELLDSFRILGVYTATPEVAPNTAINLQLYVSDIKGGGRIINGTTQSCIDPGVTQGAPANCNHDPSAVAGNYTIDTTTPDMTSNMYTGLSSAILNVLVPNTIFIGRTAREQYNGVGYLVIFRFTVDGKIISAYKRIIATNRAILNVNPVGSGILVNGAPITAFPRFEDRLTVTSGAPGTYSYMNIDGSIETRTEKYQIAWYTSRGLFDKPKVEISETTKFTGENKSGPSLLVALVRDRRGGLDFVRQYYP